METTIVLDELEDTGVLGQGGGFRDESEKNGRESFKNLVCGWDRYGKKQRARETKLFRVQIC